MEEHRPTRDLDLLGLGTITPEGLAACFQKVCTENVVFDGVVFDPKSVRASYIREQSEYGGVRVRLSCTISRAKVVLQIDVGTGDAITPAPITTHYLVMLEDFPRPQLKVYPVYTVVAEKLEAMVQLGMTNSRMKDIYDLMVFARDVEFDEQILRQAIVATFQRRKTNLPETKPIAFTTEFVEDTISQTQWRAFLHKNRLDENQAPSLRDAIERIWLRFGRSLRES